jgi:hypothetical protein
MYVISLGFLAYCREIRLENMMPELSIIQYAGSIGGISAVFALIMFFVYRNAITQLREDRKFMEDRLTQIIQDYNNSCQKSQDVSKDLTVAIKELATWFKAKSGVQ